MRWLQLRFDDRSSSTAYQRSLRSRWCNTSRAADPLAAVTLTCLLCPAPNRRGIKRCLCLTSVCLTSACLSVAYIGPKPRTERPRKTEIGREVAHVTRDSDTTYMKFKRLKVKVKFTRPLCSPPRWCVRRLQRWAWKRVGRGKLLLRCRLLSGGRRLGAHWGGEGRGILCRHAHSLLCSRP